ERGKLCRTCDSTFELRLNADILGFVVGRKTRAVKLAAFSNGQLVVCLSDFGQPAAFPCLGELGKKPGRFSPIARVRPSIQRNKIVYDLFDCIARLASRMASGPLAASADSTLSASAATSQARSRSDAGGKRDLPALRRNIFPA